MALSASELTARASRIRLMLLDVDGVLTDGMVHVLAGGGESKAFSIRDGAGIVWAQRSGLEVGLLSGRPSDATARRAAELGIGLVLQTGPEKLSPFLRLLDDHGLGADEVAYMGDDLLDLPVLARAGLSAAPADAVAEVRERVHWVSRHGGGRGAVRDFVELILGARQAWDAVVRRHLE